ncbi:uncharacterized protein METZ01_LOCUS75882, partial [marine metagenome]
VIIKKYYIVNYNNIIHIDHDVLLEAEYYYPEDSVLDRRTLGIE